MGGLVGPLPFIGPGVFKGDLEEPTNFGFPLVIGKLAFNLHGTPNF